MAESETHTRQEKQSKPKKGFGAWWMTLIAIVVALGVGLFAWQQVRTYEESVVDIYAYQQDGYLQLVLDQINLVEDRSDEEIVNNILSTVDGSSNQYWTLSRDNSIVFVKDVAETYRYRNFTDESYYDTASAQNFVNGLETNQIDHAIIDMDGRVFIASGVAFEYNGGVYRMCLLTSEHMVIDNNTYLSARVNLGIAISILVIALVLGVLFVALRGDKWMRKSRELEEENKELRVTVEQLNAELTHEDVYNTREALFDEHAAELFFAKLATHEKWPTTVVLMHFNTDVERSNFLVASEKLFDRRVLRFSLGEDLVFVFVECGIDAVERSLTMVCDYPFDILSSCVLRDARACSWQQIRTELLARADRYSAENARTGTAE